ncbi:TraR/DksA C4-type zinc finger protein [Paenibacillus crassostreae]|uniref:Molecular chaperone DnaK n=1 Tax=Paenibacillus crassostreae TaxID=1763538 RepID=A0A167C4I8_9BACL|nr:TraR/DksA C4-type zinc finger protein [Paenibacillus crassostreae]AOZ91658.1 molecular chaperone DnaK [Paenibacillus crassostreae]OAB72769.1 molecular chaperone DnaK [Paenibacillus crassostreae]
MTQSLSSAQINHLRQMLELEKEDITNRTKNNEHNGLEDSLRYQTGELSSIDNHPGDVATELYYRSMDISLLEHDDLQLDRIENALTQMNEGTYGTCTICGQSIPYDRLLAVPATRYCKEHSPRQQVSDDRPVEEEILMPPFGRTSLDERHDQNGFDGEDAWQTVERWGTSNSPAMAEDNQIESYDDMAIEADDEIEGCVESLESFVSADIEGNPTGIVRNHHYHKYMSSDEGIDTLTQQDMIP